MLTVSQLSVSGKKVLVRVDFNVPLKGGVIRDDNRIQAALPTINELIKKGARVILFSHLGKIKHKEDAETIALAKKKNDMAPIAVRLGELLCQPVKFVNATGGKDLTNAVNGLNDGEVLLMQNTRYEAGEEKNDPALAAFWANLADAYVMDAFGSAHRAHASTYGVPEILKKKHKPVACGYLVEKEIQNLSRCVNVSEDDRPYVAILGGLKVSDKIKVINALLDKCDKILIGGAMAFTFLKALGKSVGNSPVEEEQLDYAKSCLAKAGGRIVLPLDTVVGDAFLPEDRKTVQIVGVGQIPEGFSGLDVGPQTGKLFADEISRAKMVFWNGPMGVFEQPEFQKGTLAICEAVKALKGSAFTVCGGGDSASAIKQFGYVNDFSHVSTGGGASLEMIENNGHLPGIDILN